MLRHLPRNVGPNHAFLLLVAISDFRRVFICVSGVQQLGNVVSILHVLNFTAVFCSTH